MQYGAVCERDTQDIPGKRSHEKSSGNHSSRLWSTSRILLTIMSTAVIFLIWDEYQAKRPNVVDLQTKQGQIRSLKHSIRSANVTNRTSKKSLLISYDQQMDANYAEDVKDAARFLPSPSQLLQGSLSIQCGDTVSWGRSKMIRNLSHDTIFLTWYVAASGLSFRLWSIASMEASTQPTLSNARAAVQR